MKSFTLIFFLLGQPDSEIPGSSLGGFATETECRAFASEIVKRHAAENGPATFGTRCRPSHKPVVVVKR